MVNFHFKKLYGYGKPNYSTIYISYANLYKAVLYTVIKLMISIKTQFGSSFYIYNIYSNNIIERGEILLHEVLVIALYFHQSQRVLNVQ